MAIRIGHASATEERKAKNGKAGDQAREVCIRNYYDSTWEYVLRCKDSKKAEIMASACEKGCENAAIGYDQNERNTLRREAVKVNWDLSKITTPCECDCSSFMTVCAEAAGINIPYSNGNAPTTSTMRTEFKSTGMFDVFTPTVPKKRGDIIVKKGHTVMVLDNEEVTVKYFKKYTGASGSIVDALNSIGEKSTLTYRKEIAKANNISDYCGSAKQNLDMLSLLKQGKLIKP